MNRERGQALILVLILLTVGALLITPFLQLTTTTLKGRAVYAQFIKEDYAADSAIEYGLWRLLWEPGFTDNLTVGDNVTFEVTLNGITANTTIILYATEGLSDVSPSKDQQIKVTKEVTPETASPGVLTTFTYTITMQRLELDDAAFKPVEKIKDGMEPGFIYLFGSSALDGVPFDDNDLTILKEQVKVNPIAEILSAADADTWVTKAFSDQNYGTELTMDVQSGVPVPGKNGRSFVRFDITGIPAGTILYNATLRLEATEVPSATRTYDVHLVTDNWSETTVNWNNQPAVAAGATDSDTTPSSVNQTMEWGVRDDVQSWLDGAANNGWRISDAAEGSQTPYQTTFRTREDDAIGLVPELVLEYIPSGGSDYTTVEWIFEPRLDFDYGEVRTLSFLARATLDDNTRYWNAAEVKSDKEQYTGLTAPITVGIPTDNATAGAGITVTKTADPPIVYPGEPTIVTYVISITNDDIGDFDKLDSIEDYLPPGFTYIDGSASAAWPDHNSPDNDRDLGYPYNIGSFEPEIDLQADGRYRLKWHNKDVLDLYDPPFPEHGWDKLPAEVALHDYTIAAGVTYTQTFQALANLSESGSYQNEVFIKLKDWNEYGDRGIGNKDFYTGLTGTAIVPAYDLLAETGLSTLRASTQITVSDITVISWHWKKHR
jgi:uncharacterized repeat protein (TIGR01451 family)